MWTIHDAVFGAWFHGIMHNIGIFGAMVIRVVKFSSGGVQNWNEVCLKIYHGSVAFCVPRKVRVTTISTHMLHNAYWSRNAGLGGGGHGGAIDTPVFGRSVNPTYSNQEEQIIPTTLQPPPSFLDGTASLRPKWFWTRPKMAFHSEGQGNSALQ